MISVIGHAGLGNILFYYANGLYQAVKQGEEVELIFIDLNKNTVIADGRKESLMKNYVPFGGHPKPKYGLEFFGIKVKYEVDIDRYSKGREIYHEPHHYSPNCIYNIGKWNYDFLQLDMREQMHYHPLMRFPVTGRHKADYSKPCVHLRLGSIGDNFARDEAYTTKLKEYCKTIDSYYVISEDVYKAADYLNDKNAIFINESCPISALYLMSRFKKLILSRSTMSMWVAYLSDAEVTIMEDFEDEWHKPLANWKVA